MKKIGRNELCTCGSGKKYKRCCLAKDEAGNKDGRTEKFWFIPIPGGKPCVENNIDETYILRDARKIYECDNCSKLIEKGEKYYRINASPKLFNMATKDMGSNDKLISIACRKCFDKTKDEYLTLVKNNLVHEKKNYDEANPDFDDPFSPDLSSERIVVCIHCGEEYKEKEIKWSKTTDMWMCKNYPRCDGGGLGFDIHYKDDKFNC